MKLTHENFKTKSPSSPPPMIESDRPRPLPPNDVDGGRGLGLTRVSGDYGDGDGGVWIE